MFDFIGVFFSPFPLSGMATNGPNVKVVRPMQQGMPMFREADFRDNELEWVTRSFHEILRIPDEHVGDQRICTVRPLPKGRGAALQRAMEELMRARAPVPTTSVGRGGATAPIPTAGVVTGRGRAWVLQRTTATTPVPTPAVGRGVVRLFGEVERPGSSMW